MLMNPTRIMLLALILTGTRSLAVTLKTPTLAPDGGWFTITWGHDSSDPKTIDLVGQCLDGIFIEVGGVQATSGIATRSLLNL